MQFMLPVTGSVMTQAMSWLCASNAFFSASRSLNGSVIVCCAKTSGTPGELGTPKVSAPEPALISNESEWPW